MEARFKPVVEQAEGGKGKKRYCDKKFKQHLTKALKVVHGEPDNIDKLQA